MPLITTAAITLITVSSMLFANLAMFLISTAASTTLIAICRLSGIPTATMLTGITSIAFAIGIFIRGCYYCY